MSSENQTLLASPSRAVPMSPFAQARWARGIAQHLSQHAVQVSPDISERLRVAREQALTRGKLAREKQTATAASTSVFGSVLAWGGPGHAEHTAWWLKLSSIIPLLALLIGLLAIQDWHNRNEITATAEIDSSLLADDLPPSAYSDKGFLEFLNSSNE